MKNVHEIEIKLDKEWVEALDASFKKNNKDVTIDGFRKGMAPKDVYLKKFGMESLYSDAIDTCIQVAYKKALESEKLIPVCQPTVDVTGVSDANVIFKFTIITKPEVTLGEYKNLNIKKEKAKVTEEEVLDEIEHRKEHAADTVVKEDGEVVLGNTAVIKFVGEVDGEVLKEACGENYPLEIGSHTFIPGFEEGVIGMKTGETKELNLKFPENYHENLKGKDVKFTVTVEEIKMRVLPELNKEFFEDLGYDDVEDETAFKKVIEKEIKEHKQHHLDDEHLDKVLDKAIENATMEINPEIIDEEIERTIQQYSNTLSSQGMSMDLYFQMTGTTMENLKEQVKPEAEKKVKYRYLIEEVADAEKIEVTEEEVEARLSELEEMYGMDKEEILNAFGSKDVLEYDVKMGKALEFIKNNN